MPCVLPRLTCAACADVRRTLKLEALLAILFSGVFFAHNCTLWSWKSGRLLAKNEGAIRNYLLITNFTRLEHSRLKPFWGSLLSVLRVKRLFVQIWTCTEPNFKKIGNANRTAGSVQKVPGRYAKWIYQETSKKCWLFYSANKNLTLKFSSWLPVWNIIFRARSTDHPRPKKRQYHFDALYKWERLKLWIEIKACWCYWSPRDGALIFVGRVSGTCTGERYLNPCASFYLNWDPKSNTSLPWSHFEDKEVGSADESCKTKILVDYRTLITEKCNISNFFKVINEPISR